MTPDSFTPGCPSCRAAKSAQRLRVLRNLAAGLLVVLCALPCMVAVWCGGHGDDLSPHRMKALDEFGCAAPVILIAMAGAVMMLRKMASQLARQAESPGLARTVQTDHYRHALVQPACPVHPPSISAR